MLRRFFRKCFFGNLLRGGILNEMGKSAGLCAKRPREKKTPLLAASFLGRNDRPFCYFMGLSFIMRSSSEVINSYASSTESAKRKNFRSDFVITSVFTM